MTPGKQPQQTKQQLETRGSTRITPRRLGEWDVVDVTRGCYMPVSRGPVIGMMIAS